MKATSNGRFDQLARQVGRIVEIINLDENPQEPNDAHIANASNLENLENPKANIRMVRQGQNIDHVLNKVENNIGRHQNYNITRVVEQVLNRFGFNIGFANQQFFTSAFPDYIQQVAMPRGCKIPKSLTKFSSENSESTVEHIA